MPLPPPPADRDTSQLGSKLATLPRRRGHRQGSARSLAAGGCRRRPPRPRPGGLHRGGLCCSPGGGSGGGRLAAACMTPGLACAVTLVGPRASLVFGPSRLPGLRRLCSCCSPAVQHTDMYWVAAVGLCTRWCVLWAPYCFGAATATPRAHEFGALPSRRQTEAHLFSYSILCPAPSACCPDNTMCPACNSTYWNLQ